MKNLIYIIVIFLGLNEMVLGQAAALLPGQQVQIAQQAQMIQQAIDALKTAKETYSTAKESYAELEQMRLYMEKASEALKKVSDIKDLKLNDIDKAFSSVFCLKGTNRFPNGLGFNDFISMITGAFGKCEGSDIFKYTYSGIVKNFNEKLDAQQRTYDNFANQFHTKEQLIAERNEFNAALTKADKVSQIGGGYNSETTMILATKYKDMSDELMAMAHELNKALNIEGENAVQVSKGERLLLMSKAMDYELKAMEYEEKYSDLLKQATDLKEQDKEQINKINRSFAYQEIIHFVN